MQRHAAWAVAEFSRVLSTKIFGVLRRPLKRSQRGTQCVRRLLTPVVLYLGLAFLSGAIAQDKPTQWSTGNSFAKFQIWRTTDLGTYKGVDAYRDALDAAGIKIGGSANEILGRPAFPYTRVKAEVALAVFSVEELGVQMHGSSLSDVYERARRMGLEVCPAEVGPRLRLDYRNQPLGEVLHIAMEPVATYGGDRTILALTNFGGVLALIGNDGRPNFMVPRLFRFVFALPAAGRLEAMRGLQ
jgi:hypothetical protein